MYRLSRPRPFFPHPIDQASLPPIHPHFRRQEGKVNGKRILLFSNQKPNQKKQNLTKCNKKKEGVQKEGSGNKRGERCTQTFVTPKSSCLSSLERKAEFDSRTDLNSCFLIVCVVCVPMSAPFGPAPSAALTNFSSRWLVFPSRKGKRRNEGRKKDLFCLSLVNVSFLFSFPDISHAYSVPMSSFKQSKKSKKDRKRPKEETEVEETEVHLIMNEGTGNVYKQNDYPSSLLLFV